MDMPGQEGQEGYAAVDVVCAFWSAGSSVVVAERGVQAKGKGGLQFWSRSRYWCEDGERVWMREGRCRQRGMEGAVGRSECIDGGGVDPAERGRWANGMREGMRDERKEGQRAARAHSQHQTPEEKKKKKELH